MARKAGSGGRRIRAGFQFYFWAGGVDAVADVRFWNGWVLAGICRRKGLIQKDRLSVCVFGGVIMMVVVGPLLDTCSLFTMSSTVNPESAAAIYLSGIPVNIVQTLATVLTLLLIAKPMFEKLDRIKIKYGMMED